MTKEKLLDEVYMALIYLTGGFEVLRNTLTDKDKSSLEIRKAIDRYIHDLKETRKKFKGC
jgi:hypothetical protein